MDCNKLLTFERLLRKYQNTFEALHFARENDPFRDIYVREYLGASMALYDFVRNL